MVSSIVNRLAAPLQYPLECLRRPVERFLAKRSGPFSGVIKLNNSLVYILPTRVGMIFTILLLVLLIGSINYTISLGFMLTFLLAGLGNVAMLMTWRNMAGLKLKGTGAKPVFAGQLAKFAIQLENETNDRRYAISLPQKFMPGEVIDVPVGEQVLLHFSCRTQNRGLFNPGRIRIETEFPVGLFVAWTWVDLDMQALVYPVPADKAGAIVPISSQSGEQPSEAEGLEDFAGLRKYQTGEPWQRISWKMAARTDQLFSKKFTGGQPELEWIDWFTLGETSAENRLSIMTRMILDAQQAGRMYGLRMPAIEIKPDNGAHHRHECLQALALYKDAGHAG